MGQDQDKLSISSIFKVRIFISKKCQPPPPLRIKWSSPYVKYKRTDALSLWHQQYLCLCLSKLFCFSIYMHRASCIYWIPKETLHNSYGQRGLSPLTLYWFFSSFLITKVCRHSRIPFCFCSVFYVSLRSALDPYPPWCQHRSCSLKPETDGGTLCNWGPIQILLLVPQWQCIRFPFCIL